MREPKQWMGRVWKKEVGCLLKLPDIYLKRKTENEISRFEQIVSQNRLDMNPLNQKKWKHIHERRLSYTTIPQQNHFQNANPRLHLRTDNYTNSKVAMAVWIFVMSWPHKGVVGGGCEWGRRGGAWLVRWTISSVVRTRKEFCSFCCFREEKRGERNSFLVCRNRIWEVRLFFFMNRFYFTLMSIIDRNFILKITHVIIWMQKENTFK